MATPTTQGFFGRSSIRALSSVVLMVSISMGSAACNLFGSDDSSSGGGDDTVTVSEAAAADLAWSLISNGLVGILGGAGWCTPASTTTDASVAVTFSADCTNSQDAAAVSTSSDIYTVKGGVTVSGGTAQQTNGTSDLTDDIFRYMLDTSGSVTGGALGTDEVWGACDVEVTLTPTEVASFAAGDMSVVDCTTDTFSCSIQENDNVYGCEALKALMSARL